MHVKKKFYYKPMLCRKVKTILVIMGICCFPMISWAQVFLSGRIVDKKTNEPVVGASVYIRKNQVGDNANDNGLYRIKLPQNGTYLVEVSFIGYKTIKQSVTVNRNTTKNFFLEESTEVLNEVVVKASSQQAEINHIRKSPMAVTVVDGAKLRGRSSGIEEVLTRTSGIKVRKSGGLGSSSKMSIHGLEGKRVAIYIDGFPLNSPDGSFDINDIPIDAIKYIEIYKGIVPAEYGSDGLGGAINVVTREDECDLVGFTQEFASFGTSKTLVSVKKMFEKPGIQIGGGFFHNKSDNDYKMTYPVFETNLPSSAYQEVIRNNDYYRSTMYNVGFTFTKLWFDKIELECAFYNNKKGIQALDFDSRFSHTHGTNIMPTLTLEKKDFLFKNLEFKSGLVTPIIHTHLVDTARTKRQWDGTITNTMGETDDNLLNYSDDKQFEIRHKLNLKYKLKQHTFNLNNQFTYSRYRPKDDYTAEYVGFDPSAFPSNMRGNTLGLTHEYSSRNNKLQNSLMFSLYYLNSRIYRTSDKIVDESESVKKEPGKTKIKKIVYISCNPQTLARDIKRFQEKGYNLEKIKGCDMFSETMHVETVALLSKLDVDKHINIEIELDELDLTSAESKATYAQIKEYVWNNFELKVSTLYIAQIKKKCGIELREHYNKSKKEKQIIPQCTPEKEEAIMDALRHFKMI